MVTRLLLWRHGHTEWNEQHRIQGHADVPLSEHGRAQTAATAPLLAARDPVAIVASDLQRCAATADALATVVGLPVHYDPRLRERAYGQWEGLTMAEIAQRWPDSYARKRAGADAADLGHGIEQPGEVMKRVAEALQAAAEAAPEGTTVVVSHGGACRYGLVGLLGWPAGQLGTVGVLGNCHYTELRLDAHRGWVLEAHNVGTVAGDPGYE